MGVQGEGTQERCGIPDDGVCGQAAGCVLEAGDALERVGKRDAIKGLQRSG
jgi:hypothetical protein